MKNKMMRLTWAISACLFSSAAAHASAIVSVQSVTATPGSSGAFDVFLTNTGPSAFTLAAFTLGISTTNTAISFTDANISTVPNSYIFAGHSLFGPDLTGPVSGQSLTTSDVYAAPGTGAVVGSGATFGLAQVLFSVGPNSVGGPFTIALTGFPTTSLSDPTGANIPIGTLTNGTITVARATVPEPSSLLLLLTGVPLLWLRKR